MDNLCIVRANKKAFGGAEIYLQRLCDELERQNVRYEIVHSKIPKWLFRGFARGCLTFRFAYRATHHDFIFRSIE